MKTILNTETTVEEICDGFVYNELEGKGLFGLSGKLTIQPEYQRNYIYADGKIKEGIWENDKFLYPRKKSNETLNSKIEEYKSFCSEIGLTPGTEKYGECIVEAMKKG